MGKVFVFDFKSHFQDNFKIKYNLESVPGV
jgi:hypothetical protein